VNNIVLDYLLKFNIYCSKRLCIWLCHYLELGRFECCLRGRCFGLGSLQCLQTDNCRPVAFRLNSSWPQHALPKGGKKRHVPPTSGGGANCNCGRAALIIFRALYARNFSISQFFISCSTPGCYSTEFGSSKSSWVGISRGSPKIWVCWARLLR